MCVRSGQVPSNLMTVEELREYPAKPWGPQMAPKVHAWLQDELVEDGRLRLTAFGNIVMPAVANFAAHVLCLADSG